MNGLRVARHPEPDSLAARGPRLVSRAMFEIRLRFTRLLALAAAFGVLLLMGCGPGRSRRRPAGVLVLEYYAHSLAALGYPGMRRAFQAGHGSQLGAGDAGFEWKLDTSEPVTTSPVFFEADGVPIAHWWMATATDSVHFEAAALAVPGATDTLLVASVRITARQRDGAPSAMGVRMVARDELSGPHFRPWDAVPAPGAGVDVGERQGHSRRARAGRAVGRLALASGGWIRRAGAAHGRRDGGRAARTVAERPSRRLSRGRAHREGRSPRRTCLRTRAAWREWFARGAVLSTPDSLVNQAYRAAVVTLLQGHERSGDGWVPMGNPFQYRDTWLRDGARVVRALALGGFSELAREDALTLARYQLPSGALLSQQGQLDGTGQALWAFEQAAGVRCRVVAPLPAGGRQGRGVAARAARAFGDGGKDHSRGLAGAAAVR